MTTASHVIQNMKGEDKDHPSSACRARTTTSVETIASSTKVVVVEVVVVEVGDSGAIATT